VDDSNVSTRALVLRWAERGLIPDAAVDDALAAAGVTPGTNEWRSFLDRLLLWAGATFLAVATIFFVAFNWNDLGRYAKFGLAQAFVVAGIIAFLKLGTDRTPGKAGLLFASLALGALLALFGQTYQTGADPWQLFAGWSALILPWVLIGRFPGLWMLWIAIANLAIGLYYQVFGGLFGLIFNAERLLWMLFGFNTAALAAWELGATRISWLDERWAPRILAVGAGVIITSIVLYAIFDWNGVNGIAVVIYPAWLAAMYAVYRYRVRDLFMLAGSCLSIIVTVTAFLSERMLKRSDGGAFLFIALMIVGMASAAAMWLKSVATEEQP
jgi:uncharacterized membrane protein